MKIYELFGKLEGQSVSLRTADTIRVGIEYEVEDIYEYKDHALVTRGIIIHKDGSLRSGRYLTEDLGESREFITKPEDKMGCFLTFKTLFDNLKLGPNAFSPRTSIHVHMNVCSMEENNFLTFLYTYAALEPYFFNFVGKERLNNIHCVPLDYTFLSKYYKDRNTAKLIGAWSKYTAFNICPVAQQGSVEFRHLYGTNNFEIFKTWIEMIESLFNYAMKTPLENLEQFWSDGGSCKELEQIVFGKESSLTENDYFVAKMEAKSAFL